MNTKTPKVSVLMPNYNCEAYLPEAIESILGQSFTDFEFIIIDDGSSDRSWEIIQEYASRDKRIVAVKNEKNLKICKTLNKWIALAKWEYIARMDSDDISLSERFAKQVDFLDNNPQVWIVWGAMEIMDIDGTVFSKREYNVSDTKIRSKIFRYSPFCHASTMIRGKVLKKSWWYNIFLHDAEDYELYFRIWLFWDFANLDSVVYQMRVNKKSVTYQSTSRMEKLTLYVRKKAVYEFWYTMSLSDKLYWNTQFLSMYIIPSRLKIWLFNLIRNS